MFTRNAEPVSVWQSVQWQMVSALGSTSASNVISPQWQYPSIFTRLLLSGAQKLGWSEMASAEARASSTTGPEKEGELIPVAGRIPPNTRAVPNSSGSNI